MNSFISLAKMPVTEIRNLLQLAASLERQPQVTACKGKVLGLVFMNPSLRTLSSMQSAMARLGGSSFVISPGNATWSLEWETGVRMDGKHAEHYKEAIPVLASYSDVLAVRMFASGDDLAADLNDKRFAQVQAACTVPLINLESASDHPCQALADWKTMDELEIPADANFVLSWANHPKPLPLAVPTAVLKMAAQRGMNVTVLRPDEYALPTSVTAEATSLAEISGGSVNETSSISAAMDNCHVLYAKSWGSAKFYGDHAREKQARANLGEWCVSESWFENAEDACKFMHCLPVRRDVVVSADVLESDRSVVIRQAANRQWAQMAVLHTLLTN